MQSMAGYNCLARQACSQRHVGGAGIRSVEAEMLLVEEIGWRVSRHAKAGTAQAGLISAKPALALRRPLAPFPGSATLCPEGVSIEIS